MTTPRPDPVRTSPARVALFGGSFDPVHHGHLLLAQDALEELSLDLLVFVPAGINPHKLDSAPQASAKHRLAMLQACTQDEPRFLVDPLELERHGPSFTVDTVETFRARWPGARLFLLLGEDNLAKLPTWHRFADLQRWVTFITFGRGAPQTPATPPETRLPGPHLRRRVDISSTEIRRRIAQDLPIRYLVPEPVRLLIQSHALYKSPDQRAAGNFLRPVSPQ